MKNLTTDFFLSANTPIGFVSKFDMIYKLSSNWKCYILKGVPGNGKSLILQNIADKAQSKYNYVEKIHCSNAPENLDGVIVWDSHCIFVDGTNSHIVEPFYPQSNHIIISLYDTANLSYLWDNRDLIIELVGKKKALQENCKRFLSAIGSLYNDTYHIALEATDTNKILTLAKRICSQEFKNANTNYGTEHIRFLSSITSKGAIVYFSTAKALAKRIYVLEDDFGPSSKLLLSYLRLQALEKGYDIISCYCPISPFEKLEHLFIPSLDLGFVTVNRFHKIDIEPYRIINNRRFTNFKILKQKKKHLSFNKRATAQMLTQSHDIMNDISLCHNELVEIYKKSINFDMVHDISQNILDTI